MLFPIVAQYRPPLDELFLSVCGPGGQVTDERRGRRILFMGVLTSQILKRQWGRGRDPPLHKINGRFGETEAVGETRAGPCMSKSWCFFQLQNQA